MIRHISISLLGIVLMGAAAQATAEEDNQGHDRNPHWMVGVVMGHTWLPAGERELLGQKALIVPSWGLDIGYQFNHRLGLTWANEVSVQRYVLIDEEEGELERDNPFVMALELTVHIGKGFAILAGPGLELEKHQNFFIVRGGIEYELSVGHGWVFFPSAFYESKQGKFGAFTLGFGIGRQFDRKK